MAKGNALVYAFNRGLISPLALARIDIDRVQLSAEKMTNWVAKTAGAMRIRPGLGFIGSSLNDSGATWIEFIARTDDVAAIEITDRKMRVWIDDALLQHNTDTGLDTVIAGFSGSDTGAWSENSEGGAGDTGLFPPVNADLIPDMTDYTTGGVTVSASHENAAEEPAWRAADDSAFTIWADTGAGGGPNLPVWWKVDFGTATTVREYTLRAGIFSSQLDNMPTTWSLQGNDVDTGDGWTTEDTQGSEIGWSTSERRTYSAQGDTGSTAWRYWRLNFTAVDGDTELFVSEIEMFGDPATTEQVTFFGGQMYLNARTRGAVASAVQQVTVDTGNQDIEHALDINIVRGPVQFRCGSTSGADDYVTDSRLLTGNHRIAFTPDSDFYLTFYTEEDVDRIVGGISLADTGTMELVTPWTGDDIDSLRWQQSADVVFVAHGSYQQRRIVRRQTDGRSWSVEKYQTNNGPFLPGRTNESVKLMVSQTVGNVTMTASRDFFTQSHVGTLFRLDTDNYNWSFQLGGDGAFTDAIRVSGVTSTNSGEVHDREYTYEVLGTWSGTLRVLHSTEDQDFGPYTVTRRGSGPGNDTGTVIDQNGTYIKDDRSEASVNNNLIEFVKIGFLEGDYTSGTAVIRFDDTGRSENYGYQGGGEVGIVRVVEYLTPTTVRVEVLKAPSTTDFTSIWNEGAWSDRQGWPSEVSIYENRLWWHGQTYTRGSVSDQFENFDDGIEGDAAPIDRTLGEGPVDNIVNAITLSRLALGTIGDVLTFRSTSFDEPLTRDNLLIKSSSTNGAADLRAIKLDNRGIYVGRSATDAYELYYDINQNDYVANELTTLTPDVLEGQLLTGVVSLAAQRQPDTRIHFVLTDGTVAILTYEPQQELLCWQTFETDGSVEKAFVLPGVDEDQVYYHVKRTINGSTKRYLEKWATEPKSDGDTGSAISDSYVQTTDTGTELTGLGHLVGESVVVWRNKRDRGSFTVDTGGSITAVPGTGNAIVGKSFTADYKSAKLAYFAQAGTALLQPKRVDRIGLILADTYHTGIQYGADTGHLDFLPKMLTKGRKTDTGTIFGTFDQMSFSFDGNWDTDSRIHLRGVAPRPVTVLAAVISLSTKDNL